MCLAGLACIDLGLVCELVVVSALDSKGSFLCGVCGLCLSTLSERAVGLVVCPLGGPGPPR